MGLSCPPEIKLARRIHLKHKLSVPVDLDGLVSQYAMIYYRDIPIDGVDGVCIGLKNPRKKTKVVVNNSTSKNRQRFTLAHELGHIIIPWHLGTIVDDVNVSQANSDYWRLESEANRFASELLMPFNWLLERFLENQNLADLVSLTSAKCLVSEEAAGIRVERFGQEAIEYLSPPT